MDSDCPGIDQVPSATAASGLRLARSSRRPLAVCAGQYVIVRSSAQSDQPGDDDWWMGQVLFVDGLDQQSDLYSLLRIWDVASGDIRLVPASLISHVVHGLDGLGLESGISLDS